MSPNLEFAPHQRSHDLLTEQVLGHPAITYNVSEDGVALAIKREMIVSSAVRTASPRLHQELSQVARLTGTLASTELAQGHQRLAEIEDPERTGPAGDIELWHLKDPAHHSIDHAERLSKIARKDHAAFAGTPHPELPAVSPNHACVVAGGYHHCPFGPPYPALPPSPGFLTRRVKPKARVVVVDTGYIPLNRALDARVTSVPGETWNPSVTPPVWAPNPPDGVGNLDASGKLLEIVGHGTFIAGQIAHAAPQVAITAVGQLDNPATVGSSGGGEAYRIFASEFSVAHSMMLYGGQGDVILCGFAFPTVGNRPSLPIKAAIDALKAARPGIAIVAPAGNSESSVPQWPAAFDDVIGVAATDRREQARASFSNWGSWLDCCARGEYVLSTYIDYSGPIEGEASTTFKGWARWQGTSFAAPKVAGAIAAAFAADPTVEPIDAYSNLITGGGGVDVDSITDHQVAAGVSLPQLRLG